MSTLAEQPLPAWRELSPAAKAFRAAHALWAVVSLAALGYIWQAVFTRRRDPALAASIGWLSIEGAALVIGRGDCPMGPFQARLGDPVPLFELVMPPPAAKAAIPVLAVAAIAGIALASLRGRRSNVPDARHKDTSTDQTWGATPSASSFISSSCAPYSSIGR